MRFTGVSFGSSQLYSDRVDRRSRGDRGVRIRSALRRRRLHMPPMRRCEAVDRGNHGRARGRSRSLGALCELSYRIAVKETGQRSEAPARCWLEKGGKPSQRPPFTKLLRHGPLWRRNYAWNGREKNARTVSTPVINRIPSDRRISSALLWTGESRCNAFSVARHRWRPKSTSFR